MITVKEALRIILDSIKPAANERVRLLDSLDRIITLDIRAKCDLPPFNNSAMDGYAVKAKDTRGASKNCPKIFKVIEDVPAGYIAKKSVRDNEAIRIMTGALLPQGADSVVMVEDTKKVPAGKKNAQELIEVFKEAETGENVRKSGEDVKRGKKVLSKGCLLRPQEVGMLAALGIDRVKAAKKPRVGILATGDELIGINEKLRRGKIRDSNSFILNGQITGCGAIPIDLGIAKDTRPKIKSKIEAGLKKNLDMLLVSGGISVGDYDFVKEVLLGLGMKLRFWKIAMRPGKPLAFGIIKGVPVFCLPGNPVSSTIAFEEFVRPSILKMQGAKDLFRPVVRATLTEDLQKKREFTYFIRVKLNNIDGKLYASLTGPQGSGIISSLILADGIIAAPEGIEVLKKGQDVRVQVLRWNL